MRIKLVLLASVVAMGVLAETRGASQGNFIWQPLKKIPARVWEVPQVDAAPIRETRAPRLTSIAVSGQRVWAVGEGGTLASSLDGGKRWAVTSVGLKKYLFSVYFADPSKGWIGGAYDRPTGWLLQYTSDGGRTWSKNASLPDYKNSVINGLSFIDQKTGWAAGRVEKNGLGFGIVLQMSTPPNDWKVQYSAKVSDGFTGIFFTDQHDGWVISSDRILHTGDGGAHWSEQYRDPTGTAFFTGIDFVSTFEGWIVGGISSVNAMHTRDGGRTWARVDLPTPPRLSSEGGTLLGYSVKFKDQLHGFIGASDGIIFYTENGGKSWSLQNSGQESAVTGFAISGNTVFAVTSAGRILGTSVAHASNLGSSGSSKKVFNTSGNRSF